jgi:hypothetical protein
MGAMPSTVHGVGVWHGRRLRNPSISVSDQVGSECHETVRAEAATKSRVLVVNLTVMSAWREDVKGV